MNSIYLYLTEARSGFEWRSLPEFRREQLVRYHRDIDRQHCAAAYFLLAKGLAEQYGVADPVSFSYNQNGKPYLNEYPNIFFSISHCDSGVVCAVADFEIGVDVEEICHFDKALADMVCSAREMALLEESDDKARLFCRFWTEKESYAKAQGISAAATLKRDLPEDGFYYWDMGNYLLTLFHGGYDAVPVLRCAADFSKTR